MATEYISYGSTVWTPVGRVEFPALTMPKLNKQFPNLPPRYSMALHFDSIDELKRQDQWNGFLKAVNDVTEDRWSSKPAHLSFPVIEPRNEGDAWSLHAWSEEGRTPKLYEIGPAPYYPALPCEPEKFYSGCMAMMLVQVFAGKGVKGPYVRCKLKSVMRVADGKRRSFPDVMTDEQYRAANPAALVKEFGQAQQTAVPAEKWSAESNLPESDKPW